MTTTTIPARKVWQCDAAPTDCADLGDATCYTLEGTSDAITRDLITGTLEECGWFCLQFTDPAALVEFLRSVGLDFTFSIVGAR